MDCSCSCSDSFQHNHSPIPSCRQQTLHVLRLQDHPPAPGPPLLRRTHLRSLSIPHHPNPRHATTRTRTTIRVPTQRLRDPQTRHRARHDRVPGGAGLGVRGWGAGVVRAGVGGGDDADTGDGAAGRAAVRHPAVAALARARAGRVDGRAAAGARQGARRQQAAGQGVGARRCPHARRDGVAVGR